MDQKRRVPAERESDDRCGHQQHEPRRPEDDREFPKRRGRRGDDGEQDVDGARDESGREDPVADRLVALSWVGVGTSTTAGRIKYGAATAETMAVLPWFSACRR